MKIALLTPTFSPFSGIDRVVQLQAEALASKGHKVTIFALKSNMKPKKAELIELSMPQNPFFERLYRLLFFMDFPKIRKAGNMLAPYDLIISHFYPMNWIALYAKRKHKVHYQYYNYGVATPSLFRSPLEIAYMQLFKIFSNHTAGKADSAVSISKFLSKELQRETGLKSKVIYCSIDKERFHPGISSAKIRKKYNILPKQPLCLFVGRISPHKGVHLLIRAFNIVLAKVSDAKLLIVGTHTFGSYAKELKKLAKNVNSKAIIFTSFVADSQLPFYYSAADVYTTATLWEGFDLPIAEAAACGTPSVAFDIGPHKEVLKKGKLVPPNDLNQFADAIIKVLKK
jgi:glycosyltransferase involved in cell wall biosynthesis